jgi:hypothetical protein
MRKMKLYNFAQKAMAFSILWASIAKWFGWV